jgi:hypothetical protein
MGQITCRYCNTTLSPLRSLTDGEFCCDDHRRVFQEQASSADSSQREETPVLAQSVAASEADPVEAYVDAVEPVRVIESESPQWAAFAFPNAKPANPVRRIRSVLNLEPEQPAEAAVVAVSEPIEEQATYRDYAPEAGVMPDTDEPPGPEPETNREAQVCEVSRATRSLRWLTSTWSNAPTQMKIVSVLLPVLLAIAVGPSLPKVQIPAAATASVQQSVNDRWKVVQDKISKRAALELADDFRSGLDAWNSRSNLTTSWSYDAAGFVRPGPLAVFKPSANLSDYRFEFLGEIDQKAMGCAFRAANLDNFYALKFVVVRPGPVPQVQIVRYAVINGKEGPRVVKPLPISARNDTLYRVQVDVRGNDFTITTQGQIVDFWSDNRLPRGGVGFFCGRGEKARLRWVEVSHQHDALGRLCAYLSPYAIEGQRNWN